MSRQDTLQRASVHVELARCFRNIVTTQLVDMLNVLATNAVGGHRLCVRNSIFVWSARGKGHLCRILQRYARYGKESRTHRSLDKDAPVRRPIENLGAIISRPVLGGLHHQYGRI